MRLKNVIISIFLTCCTIASASDYYISSSGNDLNNGLSPSTPWKTIAKVNTFFSSLKPGDRILFKRGDIFYGSIIMNKSGVAGSPITIGAYGTGLKPIISGFTTLTGWTSEGSHIYSVPLNCGFSLNNVTIDGVQQCMGRWPNTGYRKIKSHSSNTSIKDNTLTGSPNWTGAEVVIRKNRYIIDRSQITNHSTTTMTYISGASDNAQDGYGYFIQKSLSTLDSLGEWYYDDTVHKFYMYFTNDNPDSYVVKASTIQKLIYNKYFNYIVIDNLSLQGANWAAVHNFQTNYDDITNCDIKFSGAYGVYGETDKYSKIQFNTIYNCYDYGLYFDVNGHHHTIGHNTITNVGIVPGMGEPQGGHYAGINMRGVNNIAEYNKLENIGYNGISFMDSYAIVRFNIIKNYCLVKDDGGAIYTYTGSEGASVDKHILNNIIINGIGGGSGTSTGTALTTCGIYIDDNTENVEVSGNTISNSIRGVFLHNAANCQVTYNTVYDCRDYIFRASRDGSFKVQNNEVNNNIFFGKNTTQKVFAVESKYYDFLSWFKIDKNYYCRPIDDNLVFSTTYPIIGTIYRTLEGWQSYSGQDANSHKSPIAISDINELRFEYNASDANIVVSLTRPMIDVKGTKYQRNITLLPYTSVILMIDPNPGDPHDMR